MCERKELLQAFYDELKKAVYSEADNLPRGFQIVDITTTGSDLFGSIPVKNIMKTRLLTMPYKKLLLMWQTKATTMNLTRNFLLKTIKLLKSWQNL